MTKVRSLSKVFFPAAALCFSFFLTACDSSDGNPGPSADHADGVTLAPGTPDNPAGPNPPPPSTNANTITLAVRYVALRPDSATASSPTQSAVETLMINLSNVWSQCDIRFFLEHYVAPVAGDNNLDYTPANLSQLDGMRSVFDDRRTALLVKTGTWDRSGTLGNDGSNGFSTLPPANPEGTVFEAWVATSTLLIAHELGHLIGGLGHTTTTTNLMNHYVTTSTTQLTQSQCNDARSTIKAYHAQWMR